MDNVNCHGSEILLSSCTFGSYGVHNCGHNKDAGVVCAPGSYLKLLSKLRHWIYGTMFLFLFNFLDKFSKTMIDTSMINRRY